MGRTHKWRIKRKYYDLLLAGTKTLEVRVGYPAIKKVKQGDALVFPDYSDHKFVVNRVTQYESFEKMAESEDVMRIVPRMTKEKVVGVLQDIYPLNKEKLGVYVLEIEPPHTIKYLSQLRKHRNFKKIADELYDLTDWICDDYPYHFSHYYQKYLPGLKDGTREIIGYYRGNRPVGVIILKKTAEEKKICTLYVSEDSRNMGIASKLIERGEKFLGTSTPVVTIADYKVDQFKGLIHHFGWKHTDTLPLGFYNDRSKEYVYNS